MTGRESITSGSVKRGRYPARSGIRIPARGFIYIGSAVFAVVVLCAPQSAGDGVRSGLALCARSVIPSLFPFLVTSPLLAEGIRLVLLRLCSERGEPDAGVAGLWSAFAVGMLSGFPIGAVTLVSLYTRGVIARADAERFLGVCTGASPAFLIGYFGQALCGEAWIGGLAWGMQVLLCLGGFLYLLRGRAAETDHAAGSAGGTSPADGALSLSSCLRDAVPRMLGICGAVVFFSVIRAFVCRIFSGWGAVVLCGICELTGGLRECTVWTGSAGMTTAAYLCAGSMIGFGGGCVGMQTADAVSHAGLSMRHYWVSRVCLGAAGAVSAAVLSCICWL